MELALHRVTRKDTYTIGYLYIDGEYFCDTLEDKDRGLSDSMTEEEIAARKVRGKTAIPTGEYRVTLDVVSPKFSKKRAYQFCSGKLPRLLGVKGFDGILIHIGNTPDDTDGCILVGENESIGVVVNSTSTFKALYRRLEEDRDNITIRIS